MRTTILLMVGLLLLAACEEPTATPAPTSAASSTATSAPTDTPGPAPTPLPTATPAPTATPVPTDTPEPTEVPLESVTVASLWVYLSNEYDYITPYADSSFDMEEFELTNLVDGVQHCNPSRMYADEGAYEMSCGLQETPHAMIERVSALIPIGDLRCRRHDFSTAEESVFACAWR